MSLKKQNKGRVLRAVVDSLEGRRLFSGGAGGTPDVSMLQFEGQITTIGAPLGVGGTTKIHSYVIGKIGQGPSEVDVSFFLSTDAVAGNEDDLYLGTDTAQREDWGSNYTTHYMANVDAVIPETLEPGTYYLTSYSEGVGYSEPLQVTVYPPTTTPTVRLLDVIGDYPDLVSAGSYDSLKNVGPMWRFQNRSSSSVSTTVGLYLSSDPVWDAGDQRIDQQAFDVGAWGVNEVRFWNVSGKVAIPPGIYYEFAVVDAEGTGGVGGPIVAGRAYQVLVAEAPANFTATSVSASSSEALPGSAVTFSVGVAISGSPYSGFNAGFFLSVDQIAGNGDDIFLGFQYSSREGSAIVDGVISKEIVLPAGLAPGQYYLVSQVDYGENNPELNEADNFVVGGTLTIAAPSSPVADPGGNSGSGTDGDSGAPTPPPMGPSAAVLEGIPVVGGTKLTVLVRYNAWGHGWHTPENWTGELTVAPNIDVSSLGTDDLWLELPDGTRMTPQSVGTWVGGSASFWVMEDSSIYSINQETHTGVLSYEFDLSVTGVMSGIYKVGLERDSVLTKNVSRLIDGGEIGSFVPVQAMAFPSTPTDPVIESVPKQQLLSGRGTSLSREVLGLQQTGKYKLYLSTDVELDSTDKVVGRSGAKGNVKVSLNKKLASGEYHIIAKPVGSTEGDTSEIKIAVSKPELKFSSQVVSAPVVGTDGMLTLQLKVQNNGTVAADKLSKAVLYSGSKGWSLSSSRFDSSLLPGEEAVLTLTKKLSAKELKSLDLNDVSLRAAFAGAGEKGVTAASVA